MKKATALTAWVLTVLGLLGAGYATAAEEQVPQVQAVVKAAGKLSQQNLRDFDGRFRAALTSNKIPANSVECFGCEQPFDTKGKVPPLLIYYFAREAKQIAFALVGAVLDSPPDDGITGDIGEPNCNMWPQQPCYYRQMCPGNPTPKCSRNSSGACLPGCL